MTTETDTEFTDGLSPHVVEIGPRLPSQHTLDAHQLRVLHRAIDTLAFTAEQYRVALDCARCDGDGEVGAKDWLGNSIGQVCPDCDGSGESPNSAVPRAVAELIDATTSAWQPLMAELIEQQARFNRGE